MAGFSVMPTEQPISNGKIKIIIIIYFIFFLTNEYDGIRVYLILSFDCCYNPKYSLGRIGVIGNVLYTSWTLDSQSGELGGRRSV